MRTDDCAAAYRADDHDDASGESEPVLDPELIDEDDRDARDPEQYRNYLLYA